MTPQMLLLGWGWEFPAASGPFPAHLQVPAPTSPFPACLWRSPKEPALTLTPLHADSSLSLLGGSSFQIVGSWDHASSWIPCWTGWTEVLASSVLAPVASVTFTALLSLLPFVFFDPGARGTEA